MKAARGYRYRIIILFSILLFLVACRADGDQLIIESRGGPVFAVLAHPYDETIIGGTLAMLADQGADLTVVYVTSGDDGPDMTGKGLHGKALADVREKEAEEALQALGIQASPVFLRYPDGNVIKYMDSVDMRVKVSAYSGHRSLAVAAHETQFNKRARSAYKVFVHTMRKEKYIIARNRNNNKWQRD